MVSRGFEPGRWLHLELTSHCVDADMVARLTTALRNCSSSHGASREQETDKG